MAKSKLIRDIEEELWETRGRPPKVPRTIEAFRELARDNALLAYVRLAKVARDGPRRMRQRDDKGKLKFVKVPNARTLLERDIKTYIELQKWLVEIGMPKPIFSMQVGTEHPIQFVFEIAPQPKQLKEGQSEAESNEKKIEQEIQQVITDGNTKFSEQGSTSCDSDASLPENTV